ncbi:MAG TPA: T9SS type A sorting domain-containing protein [Cytophagaceae bacterium]|jgi:hypothetical protein
MTFTGTTNAYQPFEIIFDYKLSDKVFNDNSSIEKFMIEIKSFDDSKPYGTTLSRSTYIMVDDLAFDGSFSQLPRFTAGIPDGLESWKTMDNILYPEEWVNGIGINEKFVRCVSRSAEAAEGLYSLKMSVDTVKESYTVFGQKKVVISDAKKTLSLKIKYNLDKKDTLTFYLFARGFSSLLPVFKNTDLQLGSFREEKMNLDKFKSGDTCYLIMQIKKGSPISFKTHVLIDDIKLIDGNSLGTLNDIKNISDLQVYPNPSENGVFEVNTDAGSNLKVLDMYGNTIDFSTISNNEKTTLDLGANPRGVYFLKVDNFEIKKLVY